MEMETCDLGEESKKKTDTVQLSNNSVKCYIQDLSIDIEKTIGVTTYIQFCYFCWNMMNQQTCQG